MALRFIWRLIGLDENVVQELNIRGKELERHLVFRDIQVLPTAQLPPPGAVQAGKVVIEDAGLGDGNLVFYTETQRFRVDGGAAF